MYWSKMSDDQYHNTRDIFSRHYTYTCETSLHSGSSMIGKIERWRATSGGGSVYNAWAVRQGQWFDLGWFDFNNDQESIRNLKSLKKFVEHKVKKGAR